MAIATPEWLLTPVLACDAYRFTVLDRATLAPMGACALWDEGAAGNRHGVLAIDAPDAARPSLRRAVLRWYDQLDMTGVITLDDATVVDTRIPCPTAEALALKARSLLTGFTAAADVPGHYFARMPGGSAAVLNLVPRFDGLLAEAGFACPTNTPEDWAFFACRGAGGTDLRLRIRRLVRTEAELHTFLADAAALHGAWADQPREALKKETDARLKAFSARITAQLKPLGFRKKALHWTHTRPDGWQVDFHAQKSAYTDAFYFNLRLTEPDKPPLVHGRD